MPYRDLREFLDRLEIEGEMVRVKAEVDPELEIGIIMRQVFDNRGKAILFENIKGHDIPLISGAQDTVKRYALGIDADPDIRSILQKSLKAIRNPIPPVMVREAPCQEVVLTGDKLDLYSFPAPKWHHLDGGRYLGTLGVGIVKDPETGIRNMGVYREQILAKDKLGVQATNQAGLILKKYQERGQPMPLATAIGVAPAILAASNFQLSLGSDELAAAGALNGEPVPLVKCKAIDLEVPATAEMVVEGEIPPDPEQWELEGPFGEFTGYYGGLKRKRPTIHVKAITLRNNPIYQGSLEGKPPNESNTLRCIGNSASVWSRLEEALIPGFKAAYLPDMGCASFVTIIQLEKQYYLGNARQAIMAYWGMFHTGKWTIVVDEDIDIFDRGQVEWALATRVQPHRDIIIADRGAANWLDPSIHPDLQPYPFTQGSRIGIDATKQFKGFDFPPGVGFRPEDLQRVKKRWPDYGI